MATRGRLALCATAHRRQRRHCLYSVFGFHFTLMLESAMSLVTIVLIVLLLMLAGVVPAWPHSKSWGYGPSGGVGLIVVILIVLMLMGRL